VIEQGRVGWRHEASKDTQLEKKVESVKGREDKILDVGKKRWE